MLREYEMTLITNPLLPEEESRKLFEKYEAVLFAEGGEVVKKDSWGTKKLAYPIKKHFRGHYTHYDFVGKPEQLSEAERLMRIDENVLRYLSIRIGEEVDVSVRKAEIAKAEVAAAQMNRRQQDDEDDE